MAIFHSNIKSPWAEAGASAGKGLSAGLRALAEGKLKKYQDKEEEEELQRAGLTPEEAILARKFKGNPAAQQKLISQFLSQTPQAYGESGEPSVEEEYAQPNALEQALAQTGQRPNQQRGGLQEQLANAIKSGSAKNLGLQDTLKLLAGQGTMPQEEEQPSQEFAPKAQQQEALAPSKPKVNRPRTGMSEKDLIARERIQESRQKRIDSVNEKKFIPYNTQRQAIDLLEYNLKKARDLINSGNTPEGAAGAIQLKSRRFQNEDTQELVKTLNDIVNNATAAERGPITGTRLAAQRGAKPEIDLSKKVQLDILDDYEKARVRPFKDFMAIADRLISENDYRQPENLWQRTQQIYDQTKEARNKERNQEIQQQSLKDNYTSTERGNSYGTVPDASKYVGSGAVLNINGVPHYPYVDGWKTTKPKG